MKKHDQNGIPSGGPKQKDPVAVEGDTTINIPSNVRYRVWLFGIRGRYEELDRMREFGRAWTHFKNAVGFFKPSEMMFEFRCSRNHLKRAIAGLGRMSEIKKLWRSRPWAKNTTR